MAHGGFKVIDSDMHVIEPPDLWQRYIDPAFKPIAPYGTNSAPRDISCYVDRIVSVTMGSACTTR